MTAPAPWLVHPLAEPPLTPGGDEAHDLLRRELLHPEYHQDNLVLRLITWLQRLLDRGLSAARDAPPLTTFAAMLVAVLLAVAVVWLLSRARRTSHVAVGRAVLTDEVVSAAELRARAELALSEGRYADALVDAFRAVAVHQVERDRIDDLPGATAHEVAQALAGVFPDQAPDVHRCAGLFDLVLYGGRPASREQALEVLGLDDRLGQPAGARR